MIVPRHSPFTIKLILIVAKFAKAIEKVMSKKKRPVRVTSKRWNQGKQEDLIFDGMFHCWGNEAVDGGDSGFGNFTVAVVEDPDGQVHTVNPNHVKFLDK